MKKSKTEKIAEEDSEEKAKQDKKVGKQKKKNKKDNSEQKEHFDEKGEKTLKKNDEIQEKNKEDHIGNNNNNTKNNNKKTIVTTKPSTSLSIDPLIQEMSLLTFTPELTPNQPQCELINTNLEQLTINLYETMIMKPSLITHIISLAKQELLTPKEYFAIDYTNKLLLIKELLIENSVVKYGKFVRMIDEEVGRVERLVLRCMEEVTLYEEVLDDLKKANLEWVVNPNPID